jgi:hypothetical protein
LGRQPASTALTTMAADMPAAGLCGFLGSPDAAGAAAAPAGQAAAPADYCYGSQPASTAPTSGPTAVPAAMPATGLGGLLGFPDAAGAAAAPAGQAPVPASGSQPGSQPASEVPTTSGYGEVFDVSVTQDGAYAT